MYSKSPVSLEAYTCPSVEELILMDSKFSSISNISGRDIDTLRSSIINGSSKIGLVKNTGGELAI
jgi:hypothetical protein